MKHQRSLLFVALAAVFFGSLLAAGPALAHHPFGGQTPTNALEAVLSGIAHPVIGFDHFAFIVAVGLLAAIPKKGSFWIPGSFLLAALGGTLAHVAGWNLPLPELFISASVLAFGLLLAIDRPFPVVLAPVLAAIAGLFHGYAYGEAIVGAEMTPLLAYLIGFTLIQTAIAAAAFAMGRFTLKGNLRPAGYALCGIGAAFLSSAF